MLITDGYDCEVLHDGETWDGYDEIWSYFGMEYNGTPNMFDGLSDKVYERMNRYIEHSGKLPYRYIEAEVKEVFFRRMRVRDGNKTTYKDATPEWINRLEKAIFGIPMVTQHDLKPRNALVIGDSHTLACWRTNAYIKRMDGRTLRSLSVKLPELAAEFTEKYDIKTMTVCAGNIDIRHHLLREHKDDSGNLLTPEEYLQSTLIRYEDTLKQMSKKIPDIELVHAYPIEDESRHLRKSVCLDDKPFFGSWEDRTKIMMLFNEKLTDIASRNGWRILKWPAEWYINTANNPKWFFQRMEKPYSVHLSRQYYDWRCTPSKKVAIGVDKSAVEDLFG
jgi:hypothetical protein